MEGMEPDHEGGELTTATANQGLSKSRQDVKSELRKTFLDSKNVFRKNIEEEFNIFKTEVNNNPNEISGDVHNTRLTEAEERVEGLEPLTPS